MKVYVGATFKNRLRIREMADKLWQMGFEITSSWLDETACPTHMPENVFRRKLATKDLQEVSTADLMILDTADLSEGKSVEFGFALGQNQGKLIYIVGEVRSIFHELADAVFLDWNDCFTWLAANHPQKEKANG